MEIEAEDYLDTFADTYNDGSPDDDNTQQTLFLDGRHLWATDRAEYYRRYGRTREQRAANMIAQGNPYIGPRRGLLQDGVTRYFMVLVRSQTDPTGNRWYGVFDPSRHYYGRCVCPDSKDNPHTICKHRLFVRQLFLDGVLHDDEESQDSERF